MNEINDKEIWKRSIQHDMIEKFSTKPGGKPLSKEIVEASKQRRKKNDLEQRVEKLEKEVEKLKRYLRIKSIEDKNLISKLEKRTNNINENQSRQKGADKQISKSDITVD